MQTGGEKKGDSLHIAFSLEMVQNDGDGNGHALF